MILFFAERIVAVIISAFILLQVVIPMIFGQPLFPWFRRVREADQNLGEAREQVRLAETEREIERTLRKAGIRTRKPEEPENDPKL